MRLLGSIALLDLLPPTVYLVGGRAFSTFNSVTPQIKNAPPFRASGATVVLSTAGTSITPSLPFLTSGTIMLIALCQVIGTGKTFSLSGGGGTWTLGDTSANGSACWAWSYATPGLTSAPTFSWSGSATAVTQMLEFGPDVKASGGIGASGKASGSGTTLAISGIVTGADLSRVAAILFAQTAQSIPTPSGYTSHAILSNGNGSFNLLSQAVPGAGASSSVSVAITSAAWEAFLIEIQRA